MKWLITGGCGFIGTNLISYLIEKNEQTSIRVFDNLSASTREDLSKVAEFREVESTWGSMSDGGGVELIVGDIRDSEAASAAAQGAEVVVHLAACTGVLPSVEDPRQDCETNVLGTLNVLLAARNTKAKAFILASSGAPLGEQDPPIHEEKVPRPVSPYGASKLAGEAYCHAFFGSYGLPTVALRFGNVYGPRSEHKQSVVAKFIKKALAGEKLQIYGEGNQTRDFIFVEDLVDAIYRAATAEVGGEVFQIATHRETTVLELTEQLVGVIKQRTGMEPVLIHTEAMAGEVMRNFSDVSKAKRVMGWEPRVGLEEGLQRTVDWFVGCVATRD
jgi:UDP-glucose 4-epimerase